MNGFWTLYKKEDISKITINEICSMANYERTTFYRYFLDISDILKQLENDVINNIKSSINTKSKNKSKNTSGIMSEGFKSFSNTYGEYVVVFYEKGNISFYTKFKELIKKDVFDYFNFKINDENKKECIFELLFSSLINSYSYWYRHQSMMDLDSFVKFSNNILLNGTNSIISVK
jgi:hypothetical protein